MLAENHIFENAEVLAHSVAERLCAFLEASERSFVVCLSGRSISRRLYECLTASQIGSCLTWSRTHWFWGDDRCVPHDDGDSNYQMTRAALLSRIPVPDEKIHAVLTVGLTSKHATAAYETTPKRFYGAEVNWIDNTRRLGGHGVIACAALKRRYGDVLLGNREDVRLMYLNGHERLTPSAPIINISCREAYSIGKSKRRKVPIRIGRKDRTATAPDRGAHLISVELVRRHSARAGAFATVCKHAHPEPVRNSRHA